MKKIYHILLWFFALCVLYIWSVFAFEDTMQKIGGKIWLSSVNAKILQWRTKMHTIVPDIEEIQDKKNKLQKNATEIKQKVQDGVQEVQTTIETIQTQGQQTVDAVTEAVDSGKKAIDEVNQLQKTVKDSIPKKKEKDTPSKDNQ